MVQSVGVTQCSKGRSKMTGLTPDWQFGILVKRQLDKLIGSFEVLKLKSFLQRIQEERNLRWKRN